MESKRGDFGKKTFVGGFGVVCIVDLDKFGLMFGLRTRPGHWSLKLATVRTTPRWMVRPGRTWCAYSYTASATMSVAAGS